MDDRSKLLAKISACQFAQTEMVLFLDTHPNCTEAMKVLNMHRANAAKLVEEYERKYGPLSNPKACGNHWDWVDDPWPWDNYAQSPCSNSNSNSNCARTSNGCRMKGACR